MSRDHYRLFSPARIGRLTVPNRLARSATWDPSFLVEPKMTEPIADLYRQLAEGGVGLIITGSLAVMTDSDMTETDERDAATSYQRVKIAGIGGLLEAVRRASPQCRVVAQISPHYPTGSPSAIPSPFRTLRTSPMTVRQIRTMVACLVNVIVGLAAEGFDGVQLHAAHGGLLSQFLSPYANRREDDYGGSLENRTRLFREVVAGARAKVGDLPILVKLNGTDDVVGGIDASTFPELAQAIESCGFDAIEVSGGMWDCLARSEAELGYRPVPMPEAHTHLRLAEKQSYYLKAAESLALSIPVISVGGHRDVERLESIIQRGKVAFISLCRPLISEPGLPQRWREGRGSSGTDCISCNACAYDMYAHVDRQAPWVAHCLVKTDRGRFREAQRWLHDWRRVNAADEQSQS